jgi:cell division inhibitor SepF
MSTLHKLKAYFGMVPADDVDDYEDEAEYGEQYADDEAYEPDTGRGGLRRRFDKLRGGYPEESDEEEYREIRPRRWGAASPPRLPVDSPQQVSRLRAVTDTGTQYSLSKITTLHPRSYSEARTIGEQYRDGIPVIMNLTEMDEADAKRLVDFAAGLAFGLRGSIEKVTNRVFLLSPPNVDVAAEDKRRLAEGAFFNYG